MWSRGEYGRWQDKSPIVATSNAFTLICCPPGSFGCACERVPESYRKKLGTFTASQLTTEPFCDSVNVAHDGLRTFNAPCIDGFCVEPVGCEAKTKDMPCAGRWDSFSARAAGRYVCCTQNPSYPCRNTSAPVCVCNNALVDLSEVCGDVDFRAHQQTLTFAGLAGVGVCSW